MLNASKLELYIGAHPEDNDGIGGQHYCHIKHLTANLFPDGFTMTRSEGYWNGGYEDTVVVTVVRQGGPILDELLMEQLGQVAKELEQQEVLVVETPVFTQVVSGIEEE